MAEITINSLGATAAVQLSGDARLLSLSGGFNPTLAFLQVEASPTDGDFKKISSSLGGIAPETLYEVVIPAGWYVRAVASSRGGTPSPYTPNATLTIHEE
jgi:hypothetical protein